MTGGGGSRDYVKVALKWRSRPKRVVSGPPISRGKGYPRFRAFSNCTYFRACGQLSWSFVQRAQTVADEKKKEEEKKEQFLVKYKSANILCNNCAHNDLLL